MTIRPMQARDIPAGLQLCRLSRWNQIEEDWQAFLCSPEGGGRIAECAGDAVGTVTFLRYGSCFSWLSMMLVHPDARGAGIGKRLMEAALDALADESCVRLDATPLGEPLYRRFGFREEYAVVRAAVGLPSTRIPPVAEDVRPISSADLAGIFLRDRQVFGADRSALLASFHTRAPDLAWAAWNGRTLRGYCFGRAGYLYRQLGPVVAEDIAVAQSLVARSIAAPQSGRLAVDAPCFAPEWIAWLESVGFAIERPFLRMCRSELKCAGLAANQFAIAGPEFG